MSLMHCAYKVRNVFYPQAYMYMKMITTVQINSFCCSSNYSSININKRRQILISIPFNGGDHEQKETVSVLVNVETLCTVPNATEHTAT